VHRSLQPHPNLAKPPGSQFHNDDHNYGLHEFERTKTPDFSMDTYRPYTHRWSGEATTSALAAHREKDEHDFYVTALASPHHRGEPHNLEGKDRHKASSMDPMAKAHGHKALGLPRASTDIFAHASNDGYHGGHFDPEAHESRPIRIQASGAPPCKISHRAQRDVLHVQRAPFRQAGRPLCLLRCPQIAEQIQGYSLLL
jgi:hypothetical protein